MWAVHLLLRVFLWEAKVKLSAILVLLAPKYTHRQILFPLSFFTIGITQLKKKKGKEYQNTKLKELDNFDLNP